MELKDNVGGRYIYKHMSILKKAINIYVELIDIDGLIAYE